MQRHADKDQQQEEEEVLYPPKEFQQLIGISLHMTLMTQMITVSEVLIQLYFLSKQGAKYNLQGVERALQSFNVTHTSRNKRLN